MLVFLKALSRASTMDLLLCSNPAENLSGNFYFLVDFVHFLGYPVKFDSPKYNKESEMTAYISERSRNSK